MSKNNDQWDSKIHHHHTTPQDDENAGIKRCASCGRPIVVGAECMDCAMKHPGTAAAGWTIWGLKKIFGR